MKRTLFLGLAFLLSSSLPACGESSSSSGGDGGTNAGGSAGGGAGGMGSTAGNQSGGTSGSAGVPTGGTGGGSSSEGYQSLLGCASPVGLEATAGLVEGSDASYSSNFSQFLSALRDRTPGAYVLERSTEDGGGSGRHSDVLFIKGDGRVLHASTHRVMAATTDPPTDIDEGTPIQLCDLKPASYFQDCLDAVASDPESGESIACVQHYAVWEPSPSPYLENCTEIESAVECAPPVGLPDYVMLSECSVEPKLEYAASYVEGEEVSNPEAARPLLTALRDRAPGKYVVSDNETDTGSSRSFEHVFVIDDSGTALHTAHFHSSDASGARSNSYRSSERCDLQPDSYFTSCLDDLSGVGCSHPFDSGAAGHLAWFANCTPAPAECK